MVPHGGRWTRRSRQHDQADNPVSHLVTALSRVASHTGQDLPTAPSTAILDRLRGVLDWPAATTEELIEQGSPT